MPSYYCGFDVIRIDAEGFPVKADGETVTVYNETDSSSLGTLTTDAYGVIPQGSFSIAAGKVVRFSVGAYTDVIRRTTTATQASAYEGVEDFTLVLESDYTATPADTAYNEVFVRITGDETNPVQTGTASPNSYIAIPYNPADDLTLQILAIAKTTEGAAHTFDLKNAPVLEITPNRATAIPSITQSGAAANAVLNFNAVVDNNARLLKIQWADNNTFTTNLDEITLGTNTSLLGSPKTFSLTRSSGLASAHTIYVRVAVSSGSLSGSPLFGEWSATLTATFTDSGGAGGSVSGNPPTNLYGWGQGVLTARLFWTNNGGTSSNRIFRDGVEIDSVSSGTANYTDTSVGVAGNYDYYVANDDGQTDTISVYVQDDYT